MSQQLVTGRAALANPISSRGDRPAKRTKRTDDADDADDADSQECVYCQADKPRDALVKFQPVEGCACRAHESCVVALRSGVMPMTPLLQCQVCHALARPPRPSLIERAEGEEEGEGGGEEEGEEEGDEEGDED